MDVLVYTTRYTWFITYSRPSYVEPLKTVYIFNCHIEYSRAVITICNKHVRCFYILVSTTNGRTISFPFTNNISISYKKENREITLLRPANRRDFVIVFSLDGGTKETRCYRISSGTCVSSHVPGRMHALLGRGKESELAEVDDSGRAAAGMGRGTRGLSLPRRTRDDEGVEVALSGTCSLEGEEDEEGRGKSKEQYGFLKFVGVNVQAELVGERRKTGEGI